MDTPKRIIQAFNARTQKVEDHEITKDVNGEWLFTAEDGSFFKLSPNVKPEEIKMYLDIHEKSNMGQIAHDTEIVAVQNEIDLDAAIEALK